MKTKKQIAVFIWLIGFFVMYMGWLPVTERLYECTNLIWIVISVLYDILLFTFLSYAVEDLSDGKLFAPERWKLIAALIIIDTVLSFTDYAVVNAMPHRLAVCDITAFVRAVLYGMMLERYVGKKNYLSRKEKIIRISVMAALLMIEILVSYLIYIKTIAQWLEIYKSDSGTLALLLDKSDANHLLRTYLLLFLEINVMMLPTITSGKKNDKRNIVFDGYLAIVSISIVLVISSMVEMMIFPQYNSSTIKFEPHQNMLDGNFPIETPTVRFFRLNSERQEYESYFISQCKVRYKGKNICSYPINVIKSKADYFLGDGESCMSYLDQWTRVKTSVMTYDLFGDRYIVWVEDGKALSVDMNNIDKAGDNQYLKVICRWIVLNEKWMYFKPCAEYLNKYDPNFIEEYFMRYSIGDFSESELEHNPEINTQYIQEIAQYYIA